MKASFRETVDLIISCGLPTRGFGAKHAKNGLNPSYKGPRYGQSTLADAYYEAGKKSRRPTNTEDDMERYAKDLNDKERTRFVTEFYRLWEENLPGPTDIDSPSPWGCPWYHGHMEPMAGDTPEEMAKNWFSNVRVEIGNLLSEEAAAREEQND